MMDVPGVEALPSVQSQLSLALFMIRRLVRDLHIAQRHEGEVANCSQGYCGETAELRSDHR